MKYNLPVISAISFIVPPQALLRFLALDFAFFMASCGGGDDLQAKTAALCAGVTNDNWRNANWQYDSHSVCVDNAPFAFRDEAENVYVCTFGGLPYFCSTYADGSMQMILNSASCINVAAEDVSKVMPHVVRVP